MKKDTNDSFHAYSDSRSPYFPSEKPGRKPPPGKQRHTRTISRSVKYQFYSHEHPYAQELLLALLRKSVKGLQAVDTTYKRNPDGSAVMLDARRKRPELYEEFFNGAYQPTTLVTPTRPVRELDFSPSAAYGVYNWELFFHIPFTIAVHLSKNQRFEESQRWFHYIFDPTDDGPGAAPERFWKVRPFHYTDVRKIED